MIGFIIQTSIISFIIILMIHNLLSYFINLLTLPKDKEEFSFLNESPIVPQIKISDHSSDILNCTDIHLLPSNVIESTTTTSNMKDELKKFIRSHIDEPCDLSYESTSLVNNLD